jgi:ABC-type oligopeptide transport system ATPase subunit
LAFVLVLHTPTHTYRYAAQLRLPKALTLEERQKKVEQALQDMGLYKTRQTVSMKRS